jgi:COMPASS component SWD2
MPPSLTSSRPHRERESIKLSETIHRFRPSKSFSNISPGAEITSLDFDDRGELCIASADDETLQLYDCISGRHQKTLFSKKYGCHLAKFTHSSSNIIYASTKGDDTIRYLSLHDNSYIRYFKGHRRLVNSLEVSPVDDQFISCSADDTVRLWDLKSSNCHGLLNLPSPSLAAFDPSGIIFAVASQASSSIMLYDLRNYDKAPFTTFTITDDAFLSAYSYPPRMPQWSKLEFSNDGKLMLLGTRGHSHYVIDSFAENTSKFLYRVLRPRGFTLPEKEGKETSGSVCFTPDGRYIVGGQGERGVAVWDTNKQPDEKKSLLPSWDLVENVRTQASVVAFNHKTNLLATAYKEAVSCFVQGQMRRWLIRVMNRYFGCRSNMHRILRRVRSGNELTSNGG